MKSSNRFDKINLFLKQMLPNIRLEAAKGRWADVKPEHFRLINDERQSYLLISYCEKGIYNMNFKVGTQVGGFDPDVSGEWFECIYEFNCFSKDSEIKAFILKSNRCFIDWSLQFLIG